MIACRSLFRINLVALQRTNTYTISLSKTLQNNCFIHGLNKNLEANMDWKKRKMVTQTWRAVSAHSSPLEGDDGNKEAQQAVCSTVSAENTDFGVDIEQFDHNKCDGKEVSNKDGPLGGEIMGSEEHKVSVEVGASLMRFIKGKGGATQREIEENTGVKIIFPSSRKEDFVIINGNSAESVTKASEQIQIIIDKAVKSPSLDYSHFVSLPLAIHPELVDKLFKFQNSILGTREPDQDEDMNGDSGEDSYSEEEKNLHPTKIPVVAVKLKVEDAEPHVRVDISNIPLVSYAPKPSTSPGSVPKSSQVLKLGIEKSIFIKPKTFHLTVLMLKLWNQDRVKAAADVLQSVSSQVMDALNNRPVAIRLKGLECMKGSLAKARVLYAPVEEIGGEGRLLRACQVITDAFIAAGLVMEKDAQQKLKLHATIMNARHRKRTKRTRKFDSFDARGIFNQYGSDEWGEYLIREAHLSQRFVFDEDGYYHCCASIPFPQNIQID